MQTVSLRILENIRSDSQPFATVYHHHGNVTEIFARIVETVTPRKYPFAQGGGVSIFSEQPLSRVYSFRPT